MAAKKEIIKRNFQLGIISKESNEENGIYEENTLNLQTK